MKTLCLLLLLIFSTTHAQQIIISGNLTDSETGESVINANILINSLDIQTTSNNYGFYAIILPKAGNYTVELHKKGYAPQTQTINVQENTTLDLVLDANVQELEGVVVSSNKNNTPLGKPQMSLNKIDAKAIEQIPTVFGEPDLLKAIELLPGVSNAGEGTGGFNVRGGAADQNLVLLDEQTIYNTSHLFGFFSVFNSDVIKDVQLYKGGIPAKYGGRVSSVLDVRQKEGNLNQYHGEGSVSVVAARALLEGPITKDKGSFLVAGRSSYAHLFLQASEELNDNIAYFYDLNLKASYQINKKNKFYLSGYFGNDVATFSNAFNNSYGNTSLNLRWNNIASPRFFSNLSAIYSRYDYDLNIGFIDLDWQSNIQDFNLNYDFEWKAAQKIKVDFGMNSHYYKFNPGEVRPSSSTSAINPRDLNRKQALEAAFYADISQKINAKLSLRYGLRWSYFARLGNEPINQYANNQAVIYNNQLQIYQAASPIGSTNYDSFDVIKDFNNFEPRFAASYKINNQNAIKASYNRTIQYLHLLSNTNAVTPLDIWTPSGQYIQPQKANQWAAGYFKTFKNNQYALDIEAYYKTVDNRIDYIDGAELIAQDAIETQILNGEARAFGMEFLLKKNTGKLTGWLAYTLSNAQQRTSQPDVGGLGINQGQWYQSVWDRTHDVSLVANYQLNNKWNLNANFIYQTGRPVTFPNGRYNFNGIQVPSYGLRNQDRLPDYHRIDVSASYTPRPYKNKGWRGQWTFSIYNLYNRRNAASITFEKTEAIQTAIFGIVPSVGYSFKF